MEIDREQDKTMTAAKDNGQLDSAGDAAGLAALIMRASGQTNAGATGLPPVER